MFTSARKIIPFIRKRRRKKNVEQSYMIVYYMKCRKEILAGSRITLNKWYKSECLLDKSI